MGPGGEGLPPPRQRYRGPPRLPERYRNMDRGDIQAMIAEIKKDLRLG